MMFTWAKKVYPSTLGVSKYRHCTYIFSRENLSIVFVKTLS